MKTNGFTLKDWKYKPSEDNLLEELDDKRLIFAEWVKKFIETVKKKNNLMWETLKYSAQLKSNFSMREITTR